MKNKAGILCCAVLGGVPWSLHGEGSAQPGETSAGKAPQTGRQPNIVLIVTDQHRFDCLGAMGNAMIKTPNLDALAGDGMIFMNGYSSTPSSTPARAALLTGMSPWHHGMAGYGVVAENYPHEMPRMLHHAGYYSYAIGKLHYHPQRNLHGYDGALLDESGRAENADFVSDYRQWFAAQAPGLNPDSTGIGWNEHKGAVYALDEKLHPTEWTAREAVRFISGYDKHRPMFLTVSFARPHSPYDPPQRFYDIYKDAPVPAPYVGEWCGEFADRPNTKNAAYGDFGPEHALESRRFYYAAVTFIDEKIGEITAELRRRGMYDNTLIVFVSDHGDMLGDHHHWRKTYAYEGSAHVPFVVKFPAAIKGAYPPGAKAYQPVELRDVLPTMLDAAGMPIPAGIDGRSLMEIYRNKKAPWREWIDLEHTGAYDKAMSWAALTDGQMKYVYFFRSGHEQLFDISHSKAELHSLAGDPSYGQALELWRGRMAAHLEERGERFVKDGKLQTIDHGILYSPHYPRGDTK